MIDEVAGVRRRVAPTASLRFRIAASVLTAVGALLLVLFWLSWRQRGVQASLELAANGYLPLVKVVARIDQDRERVDRDLQRLLDDARRPGRGGESAAVIYTDELRTTIAEGRIQAQHATALAPTAEVAASLNGINARFDLIESLFEDYERGATEVVRLAESGDRDEARARFQPLSVLATRLRDEVDRLDREVEGRLSALTRSTADAQIRTNAVAAALATGAVALALALVVAAIGALRPISALTEQVQRLAAGDKTHRLSVQGRDEIAILAGEFDRMMQAVQSRDEALQLRATELDRLSVYLASVLDSLDDALVVEEAGRVTLANPASTRRWGAETGKPLPEALRSPHRTEIAGPDRTVHQVRVAPFGPDGRIVAAADVTEVTRARERLVRSEQLALIGQMLAQITHEVRNPLNALSLNAELLSEEISRLDPTDQTDAKVLLDTITQEIERLVGVTAHYLQLARRPRPSPASEDPASLVEDVTRLLAAELADAHVTFETFVSPIGRVWVDAAQLKQALLNLVRNAVEAGARHLSLRVERISDEVIVRLSDDGVGMGADELERAFEPFWSTKAKGTGLGLAIVRQIVEDHAGRVTVDSTPGRGTTIRLVWPARPLGEAPGAQDAPPG